MRAIQISDKLVKTLNLFEGEKVEDKIGRLVLKNTEYRIRYLNDELAKFESSYGLSFGQFARAWKEGKIAGKHTHKVETDYIEWEALEMEKRECLRTLRKLRKE